ncbi:Rhodanese-like domain containing protein [Parasponia andersonii]|uniref:Rhodanese-like domain containing protein n=1 Tax=Parasponia andersonii TaxID=3476 RepID=A0A2P5BD20_PARAD|nr:Rhodanese-like domain containing protein [Parasponia andersonii]
MLPVCSATPTCSSHSQISFHGGLLRPSSSTHKEFETRCILEYRVFGLSNDMHFNRDVIRTNAVKSLYSNFVNGSEKSVSVNLVNEHSCQNGSDYVNCTYSDLWNSSTQDLYKNSSLGSFELKYIENSNLTATEMWQLNGNENVLSGSAETEAITSIDSTPEPSTSVAPSVSLDVKGFEDFVAGVSRSFSDSVNKGDNALKNSVETINSSISSIIRSANGAVDGAVGKVFSTFDQTGELGGNKLTNFSNGLKESTNGAAVVAVDALRRTIVGVKDALTNGTSFVLYSYQSAKELLPPEIRDALNSSEERATEILKPVKIAFQKVYIAIEGFEGSLGFDPNDPIVPFVLLLGTSATLWVFFWVVTYSGYAGDLSPQLTLEILTGKENAVLIDIRPEILREKDGIPDLRRAARFRYTSVNLPEVYGSQRKLFKNGRDLENTLTAAVIQNLKIVQDRSRVIVLDADGSRSKGIARSLRKLGVKASISNLDFKGFLDGCVQPYLVQGGFQSWVKQGLRIKELKSESTLTVLSEEAEAILEDIKPSPVQAIGYGVGLLAALYAILEWEKTLQFIGVFGLGQTIIRRVATYEDAKDFRRDVRLLLAPVRLGAQAFAWAAGKLETNRIGLPTSPSSLDVQNRVLQAAAKHESQPSDAEGLADPSPEATIPVNENVDLSEA